MSKFLNAGKQIISTTVVTSTILWTAGFSAVVPTMAATTVNPGDLIQQKGSKALWLVGSDGKAGFFANEGSYVSWYGKNFKLHKTLSTADFLQVNKRIGLGAAVPYRAGTNLVIVEGDPKVYAVEPSGVLRPVPSADVADKLYGKGGWNNKTRLHAVGSAFLGYYTPGDELSLAKPPVGLLLKSADGKWWIVDKDGKREVTPEGLKANKLDPKWAVTAAAATLDAIPKSAKSALSAAEDMFSKVMLPGQAAAPTPAPTTSPTTSPAPTTSPTTSPAPTGTPAPTSTGKLMVAVAKSSPAADYVASGSAFHNFAEFEFKAEGGDVVVTDLNLKQTGLGSGNDLSNVYLFDGGKRLTLGIQLTTAAGEQPFAKFTSSTGLFIVPGGQTKTIAVKGDLAASTVAGKTYQLGINAKGDVKVSGTASVEGAFPLTGSVMNSTVLSQPSLATLGVRAVSVGTSLNAGTKNQLVAQFQFQANNSNVKITQLMFTEVGTINASSDLANIKVMKDNEQVGKTLDKLASDGSAFIDLGAGYTIQSGGTVTFNVYADVIGTPNREFRFSIQRNYDIVAWDTYYNRGILTTALDAGTSFAIQQATAISVRAGTLLVNTDDASPTGNISTGINNVEVAKFKVTASGEPVKLLTIPARIQYTNAVACSTAAGAADTLAGCDDANFANVRLIDDKGVQLGSTFSTVSAANSAAHTAGANGNVTFTFGSSASPLNYIVEANATRMLSVKVDILTTMRTEITAFRWDLTAGVNNAQGTISLQNASSSANNGRALTVVTTPFTHVVGQMGNVTYVRGATNKKVAQFRLAAGAGEGINLTNLTVQTGATAAATLQNLRVKVGDKDFGITQGTLANSTNYTFSGAAPAPIAIGGTADVDVYADIQSSAAAANITAAVFINAVGSGTSSGTARTSTGGNTNGQTVTIATGGSLTLSSDSSSVPANNVSMGSNDIEFGSFKLSTGTNEGVNITSLMVTDTITGSNGRAAISYVRLYDEKGMIGSAITGLTASGGNGTATFQFNPAYNIPANGIKTLKVVANTTSYNSTASSSGSTHTFGVAANADVTSTGDGSGTSIVATGAAVAGYTQTVYRTSLMVKGNDASPSGLRSTLTQDRLALFDFTAGPNYDVLLQQFTVVVQTPAAVAGGNTITARDGSATSSVAITGAAVDENATSASSVLGAAITATGALAAGDIVLNGTNVGAVAAGGSNAAQATNIVNAINAVTAASGVTAGVFGAATAAASTRVALYRVGTSGDITIAFGTATPTAANTGLTAATTRVAVVPAAFSAIAPTAFTAAGDNLADGDLRINTTSVGAFVAAGAATAQSDGIANAINAQTGVTGVTAARATGTNTFVLLRTTAGQVTITFAGGGNTARTGLTANSAATKTYVVSLPAGYSITAGQTRTITLEVDSTNPNFDTGSANSDSVSARITQVVWNDQGGSSADVAAKDLPINASKGSMNY